MTPRGGGGGSSDPILGNYPPELAYNLLNALYYVNFFLRIKEKVIKRSGINQIEKINQNALIFFFDHSEKVIKNFWEVAQLV